MKKILLEENSFMRGFQKRIFDVVNYTVFGIFAVVAIYPLYYIYINAISNPALVTNGQINLYPKEIDFSIFMDVFRISGFAQAAGNSVLRTILGAGIATMVSAVLGYIMTKKELKHRKFWYRYFILTMYLGAGLIPGYLNLQELGFLNSFWWIYIAGNFSQAYNLVLAKTYIENLPGSLEEAAYIDGAGYFKRFVHVILPLSKPILATIAVFVAVGQWNSYMDTILYMTKGGNQTLQSTLYRYINQSKALADAMKAGATSKEQIQSISPLAVKYAVTAVTLTPVLLVYPFFQRFFTKGIMIGAVKG